MPVGQVYPDGSTEQISRHGSLIAQHIATSLQRVTIHINAFKYPVWGTLERLAPCLNAGVPAIVKLATKTASLTETCVRTMLYSGLFPEGALQLVVGPTGDLLDRLGPQGVVGFTGSAQTAHVLRSRPDILSD